MTIQQPRDPFSEVVNQDRRWTPDWYSWLSDLSSQINALSTLANSIGTWTNYIPTVNAQTGSSTFLVNEARYSKLGNVALVYTDITVTNAGTGSGAIIVSVPLPIVGFGTAIGREVVAVSYVVSGQVFAGGLAYFRGDNSTPIVTGHRHQVSMTYKV